MAALQLFSLLVLLVVSTKSNDQKQLENENVFRNTATVRITLGPSNLPFLSQMSALDILEAFYDRLENDNVRAMALAQSFSYKPTQCQWNVVAGVKDIYIADKHHLYVTLNVTPITDPNISQENSEVVPETNAHNFYLFGTAINGEICSEM